MPGGILRLGNHKRSGGGPAALGGEDRLDASRPLAGQPVVRRPAPGPRPGAGTKCSPARDLVALAYGMDGFSASPLAEGLRGAHVTHLVIAGFGLEGPVHSTLRTANDRGWECLVVADACAAFEPDLAPAALSTIEMSGGLFGVTATAQEVLAALGPMPSSGASEPSEGGVRETGPTGERPRPGFRGAKEGFKALLRRPQPGDPGRVPGSRAAVFGTPRGRPPGHERLGATAGIGC